MTADGTAANRAGNLRATLVFAQQDEDCEPARLPTLFRVDQELAAPGGRRYLADCGGRGECYGLTGAVCLQHLDGPGKRPGGRWNLPRGGHLPGSETGAGCGGGGCGS